MTALMSSFRGVLGGFANRLFVSPFAGPMGQSVRWKNLFEMHLRGGRPERRPQRKSPISGHPQMRGVVLKVLIKKPKKPNSANRKCVLVRLTNGKETVAWIPGEGHNLQEHSQVLVEGGRKPDLIGVKIRVIRGYWVLCGEYGSALVLLSLAGATDVLDGMIARHVPGQSSVLGTIIDPLADKILMSTAFVTLTYVHLIPVPLTVLVLSRDIALIFASILIRLKYMPADKKSWRTFLDITEPILVITPSLISKVNTFFQISLVCITLAVPTWNIECPYLPKLLWYLTAGTTFASGIGYAFSKTALRKLDDRSSSSLNQ
uniref:Small ribosomal subunit protein uS12m n=1 Tax=Trichuris muris TaxID=70415 RepID=A0A5S6R3M9_TRIMR